MLLKRLLINVMSSLKKYIVLNLIGVSIIFRVMRTPSTHLRTSAATGCVALSSERVHCTSTRGHLFVRFGQNKLHYDGANFRLRTAGQSAGFDVDDRISLF
jgi:hypothetical protein